jgi:Tfp pilus assembly protein PilE
VRLQLPRNTERGFTLIELLVVAPVAILAIAGLISLMVALIGDVSASRERSVSSYDVQDALDRIEQDARIATTFMPTFSLITSPQGRNNTTGQFTTTSGDIIMSQYATTASPYDATRKVVYYADQPYACNSSTYTLNRPMTVRVIYFTTTSGSNTTLWRRTILPSWSTTASGTTKVCDTPWQRDSCAAAVMPNANCQAQDEKMLDYVSTFSTTYYADSGATTTDVRNAASFKVSLTQTKQVAGESIATNGVTRASHINVTTDDIPAAPSISVYNPAINTYNNPVLTTFSWDAVKNAAVYTVRYQINGGAWQNQPDQTGTQFQVTDARPNDQINIRVASKNDMGASSETLFTYTTPVWTVANLEGDWDCYQASQATWSCPAYTLLSSDVIVMRGLASGGTGQIFTLPVDLRPKKQLIFSTLSTGNSVNADMARIDVWKSGAVTLNGTAGNTAWLSFDAVRYIRSNSNLTWTVPTFSNGWGSWGGGTSGHGAIEYTSDSMGRTHLSGVLAPGTNTAGLAIHSLPANYNERGGVGIFPAITTGYNIAPFNVASGAIQARGLGASWMSESVLYPNNTSGAAFNAIAPQAGWTNYGGGWGPATYSKTSDGLVVLQGLIIPTTVSQYTVLFTLPAGYRPAKQTLFGVADAGDGTYPGQTYARLDVLANGQVQIIFNATSGKWLSLEGINFYQEN